jgi:hypothetical protein
MQYSRFSSYFLLHTSQYSPQHFAPRHPRAMFPSGRKAEFWIRYHTLLLNKNYLKEKQTKKLFNCFTHLLPSSTHSGSSSTPPQPAIPTPTLQCLITLSLLSYVQHSLWALSFSSSSDAVGITVFFNL